MNNEKTTDNNIRIVGCFLEYNGKFAILFRHSHKPDGDTWGLPGGKVEPGETDEAAILRELEEETGYQAAADQLVHLGTYDYISSSNKPYTYIAYRIILSDPHEVKLEETAHAAYKWVTPEECDNMSNLIPGFHKLLRLVGYVK